MWLLKILWRNARRNQPQQQFSDELFKTETYIQVPPFLQASFLQSFLFLSQVSPINPLTQRHLKASLKNLILSGDNSFSVFKQFLLK